MWDYVRYILKIVAGDLRGLRLAIDCANGSVSETAEKLFSGLGATCYMVNCAPDGTNAAPNILPLTGFVKEKLCQAGISFNSDGSGFVLIDEAGSVIDGDKILAILAEDAMNRQLLRNNSVVASEQCSMGFFRFCEEKGIKTIITPSDGIFDEMRRSDCNMGGNQLGKLYSFEENTLSDGQLSVIRFLELLQKSEMKLSAFVSRVESYPQIVVTVKIGMIHKGKWQDIPEVTEAVKSAREALGSDGRVLVTESASEPVVRISVEGKQFEKINELAMGLAECVKANCPK